MVVGINHVSCCTAIEAEIAELGNCKFFLNQNPLFPFPVRLFNVFSALTEKANSQQSFIRTEIEKQFIAVNFR
jgi:hypothetical protein